MSPVPTIAQAAALRDMIDGARDRPPAGLTGVLRHRGWVEVHRQRISGVDDWPDPVYEVTADGRDALHRFLMELIRHGFAPEAERATLARLALAMAAVLDQLADDAEGER